MTAVLEPAATPTAESGTVSTAAPVNVRAEAVFLQADTYTLTARQIVYALAHHLARYGDTLTVAVVDPLCAIDAVLRFDLGHDPARLIQWTARRTPADVATILARAEQIARDYFGTGFPPVPW